MHQTNQLEMSTSRPVGMGELPAGQTRLTLPLSDAPVLGPFRLDHDAQFTSKVFHIKPQLFEALSKSMSLVNPQTASVVQELQFRAYLIKAPNGNDANSSANVQGRACNWPELFQVSVNQRMLHLDRSKVAHKAIDVFQFCQMGNNVLDIQVNDCYCTHEFILEAVDRPTIKAFMNSCFKSRLLNVDSCIQKIKFNFASPAFLMQNQQASNIINEYVAEFSQGVEQTKCRVSLRCPISLRRMRTPTRGHSCKHLQCFDLENFLLANRERSQWFCPICSLPIPFNMLELDQHQLNILQAMFETLNTDDILMDSNGQWSAYFLNSQVQKAPIGAHHAANMHPVIQPQVQPQPQQAPMIQNTAKSTGTFHPQALNINGTSPHQQPMRPTSGPTFLNRPQPAQVAPASSPASWDGSQPDSGQPAPLQRNPPPVIHQPMAGRRSANGSPLAKKAYAGQYAQQPPQPQPSPVVQQQQQQQHQTAQTSFAGELPPSSAPSAGQTPPFNQQVPNGDNSDDLSPLAAMERTIIQHEQQMGPPPFDPNSLTSSPAPLRASNTAGPLISSPATGQQQQAVGAARVATPTGISSALVNVQASPESRNQLGPQSGPAFSPAHAVSTPTSRLNAAPSPHQARMVPSELPQSPVMQQQLQQAASSASTPATPSSASILIHGGPETPATPTNSQQHCGPSSVSGSGSGGVVVANSQSPHIGSSSSSSTASGASQQAQTGAVFSSGVDHQPLSNGSASAGSITSTSTMTPSGQSLGSVGMGGDSRCGTAPLQGASLGGLDDLMLPGGSSAASSTNNNNTSTHAYGNNGNASVNNTNNKLLLQHPHNAHSHLDEKNDILMGKLMMDSSESLLRDHRDSELAIALEEAEWKQQLDRGKSEHLANFLNEPLMNSKHNSRNKYQFQHQNQQQPQMSHLQGNNKLISGGLNPSDDEGNHSHNSSPSHNLDQLEFANYLDSDTVDNGAGLPPDDSILDLFER